MIIQSFTDSLQKLKRMARNKNEMKKTSASWLLDKVRIIIEYIIRFTDGDKTFYITDKLDWVANFEKNYLGIRRELIHILDSKIKIKDWQSISNDPNVRIGTSWKVFIFKVYKNNIPHNCNLCPITAALINKHSNITTAWFSILEPYQEIPMHRGPYNGVLRYHLALIIPDNKESCGIQVGNDIRHWNEGESLLFDDTHLHKAWNNTGQRRVVLFMDVIRDLPFPVSLLNKAVINLIKYSEFTKNVQINA
jgi:aspartyl/asparaginyl beta-hydroxylase (cupin superfamily)